MAFTLPTGIQRVLAVIPWLWLGCMAQAGTVQAPARIQPSAIGAAAWVSTPQLPPAAAAQIDLGPWEIRKQSTLVVEGGAHPIGAPRASSATDTTKQLHRTLVWQPTERGGWISALHMRSPGAYGMRLGVWVDELPATAVFRLYSPAQPAEVMTFTGQRIADTLQANQDAGDHSADGRTWWTPEVAQDEVILEIELAPGTATQALRMAIPRVMHIYENIWIPKAKPGEYTTKLLEAGRCNLDVQCTNPPDPLRDAVARMSYIDGGIGYLCTGTLISNTGSDATPYFLTAHHCIHDQTTASTLQTYWFYQSDACNASSLSPRMQTLRGGAKLLYSSATPDMSLLRLHEPPPAGALFAAWDSGPLPIGSATTGIHHPSGDMQKISFGSITDYKNCSPFDAQGITSCNSHLNGQYYEVLWKQGNTESGSSGSAIFSQARLRGVLSSGQSACYAPSGKDTYARFDAVFPKLSQWLDPQPAQQLPVSADLRQAVYRFFNTATHAHFYTISAAERDQIIAQFPQYRYEHIAFYAHAQAAVNQVAVSRFFNQNTLAHFYTASTEEREYVQNHYPQFMYEGISWYAGAQPALGTTPLFRFSNLRNGTHFYTVNAAERDSILQSLPDYRYEGVSYYVWLTSTPDD